MRLSTLWIDVMFPDKLPPEAMNGGGQRLEGDGNPARDSLRALLALVLFALTFCAAMLATVLRGEWARGKVTSLVSMVGGGVFLATCLLDLLPDAMESFEKTGIEIDFPVASGAVGLGFVIVLSIEQVVLHLQEQGYFGHNHIRLHDHPGDEVEEGGHGHEHGSSDTASLSAIILVLAISIHACFEGLSLAVIEDVSKLLQIFFALTIHKVIIGFSVGVRLVQSNLRPITVAMCAFILAIQVVVGGIGGISIMHILSGGSKTTAAIVTCILQGIACGTFLYITTFEILPHEFEKAGNRLPKLLAFFVGCAVVIAFMFIFPEAG